MKFAILAFVIALFAISASALTVPLKAVIISYPDDTPTSVLTQAKSAMKAAGGIITHEYKLFKGFAAKANPKAISAVQALGDEYVAMIEEDNSVSINDKSKGH